MWMALLRVQLLSQNHFFNDPADAPGRHTGGCIADGGDHDIKHDPPEQPGPMGHGQWGQNIRGSDSDDDLPGIGQKKCVKDIIADRLWAFLQDVTFKVHLRFFKLE